MKIARISAIKTVEFVYDAKLQRNFNYFKAIYPKQSSQFIPFNKNTA